MTRAQRIDWDRHEPALREMAAAGRTPYEMVAAIPGATFSTLTSAINRRGIALTHRAALDRAGHLRSHGQPRPTEIDSAIEAIELAAARRCKVARAAYRDGMIAAQATLKAEQARLAGVESEELKAAERWRVSAIAAVDPSQPVKMADLRSLKRKRSDDERRMVTGLRRVGP